VGALAPGDRPPAPEDRPTPAKPASGPLASALSRVLDDIDAVTVPTAGQQPTPAAVLVALIEPDGVADRAVAWQELEVVLTLRRSELRRHAGEISCPGGRWEPADESLYETALRESEEEIGLPRAEVVPVGALSVALTFVTDYAVQPFAALIPRWPVDADAPAQPRWKLSTSEVDAVIEPSLGTLLDGRRRTRLQRHGISFETETFTVGEHVIWGATYRILDDLIGRLQRIG
jgi:8-oxo-dGTP pyrophosphatase MutT (NUDIX family)